MTKLASSFICVVAVLLLAAFTPAPTAAPASPEASSCLAFGGSCDTWDPDVDCWTGGIWWQTACTHDMEWCDGS